MFIPSIFFILIALAVSPLYENQNEDLDFFLENFLELYNNLQFNDALFYVDGILNANPDNYLALTQKGNVLIQLERYDEALLYYEKAIEINPDLVEAINGKAVSLYQLNRDFDALTTFYDSYKIDPSNLDTVTSMATIIDEHPLIEKLDMITAYVKLEIRNSDDQLVGYTESHDLGFQHPLALMFLEDKAEWKPIEIDGEEFELLEYSTSFPVTKPGLSSYAKIALKEENAVGVFVIHVDHNGFLTSQGDKMTEKIILLRLR